MVTITLYMRQQKKHWYIEQFYGLCGRGRGWEDLGEWHWNMYTIMYETSCQSRFDARYWMLGAGALGRPRGMVWGGRWEEDLGWGTHVHLWWIHFDIWQNQYNIVKFKKKKRKEMSSKERKKKKKRDNNRQRSFSLFCLLLPNGRGSLQPEGPLQGAEASFWLLSPLLCGHRCALVVGGVFRCECGTSNLELGIPCGCVSRGKWSL